MSYLFASETSYIVLEISEHRISLLHLYIFLDDWLRQTLLPKSLLYFHDKVAGLCFASLVWAQNLIGVDIGSGMHFALKRIVALYDLKSSLAMR